MAEPTPRRPRVTAEGLRSLGAPPAPGAFAPVPQPQPAVSAEPVPAASEVEPLRGPSALGATAKEIGLAATVPLVGIPRSMVTDAPGTEREAPGVSAAARQMLERQGLSPGADPLGELGAAIRGGQPEGLGALTTFSRTRGVEVPILNKRDGGTIDTAAYLRRLNAAHFARQDASLPVEERARRAADLAKQDFVAALAVGGRTLPWVTVHDENLRDVVMSLPRFLRPVAATFLPATRTVQTGTLQRSELMAARPIDAFARAGAFTPTLGGKAAATGELPSTPQSRMIRAALAGDLPSLYDVLAAASPVTILTDVLGQSGDEETVQALMEGADVIDVQPVLARELEAAGVPGANAAAWAGTAALILAEPDPLSFAAAGVGKAAQAGVRALGAARDVRMAARLRDAAKGAAAAVEAGDYDGVMRRLRAIHPVLLENMVAADVARAIDRNPSISTAMRRVRQAAAQAEETLPARRAAAEAAAQTQQAAEASIPTLRAAEARLAAADELLAKGASPVTPGTRHATAHAKDLEALTEARRAAEEAAEALRREARTAVDNAARKRGGVAGEGAEEMLGAAADETARRAAAGQRGVPRIKGVAAFRTAQARAAAAARRAGTSAVLAMRERLAGDLRDVRRALAQETARARPDAAQRAAEKAARAGARIQFFKDAAAATERSILGLADSFDAHAKLRGKAKRTGPVRVPMTPLADGARVEGKAAREALERAVGKDALDAFLARGTPAGDRIKGLLDADVTDIKGADLPGLYADLGIVADQVRMAERAPAARAETYWREIWAAPQAEFHGRLNPLSPEAVEATLRGAVRWAMRFADPSSGIQMNDALKATLRASRENMDIAHRDLRDIAQSASNEADLVAKMFAYIDTNAPVPHVRGNTILNVGDAPMFRLFQRFVTGMGEDAKDIEAVKVVALSFLETGANTPGGTAFEAAMVGRVLDILRDPSVTNSAEFATRLRSAVQAAGGSVDSDTRSVPKMIVGIINGAIGDRMVRGTVRGVIDGFTQQEMLDVANILERKWRDVEDFDRAFMSLNALGLPGAARTVSRESSHDLSYRMRLVGVAGETNYVPRQLIDDLNQSMEKWTKEIEPYSSTTPRAHLLRRFVTILKESYTSGFILPNPGYPVVNVVGEGSQMWLTEGAGTAAQVWFHGSLAAVPFVGRKMQDALSDMARKIGGPVLPSLAEAMVDPHMGAVLRGDAGQFTTRMGDVITYDMLRRELFDGGIQATFIREELATHKRFVGLQGVLARHQENINEFAAHWQARQRTLLYLRRRAQGFSPQDSVRSVMRSSYDWKHGVGAAEAEGIVQQFMFYRFVKLSMLQAMRAFAEPFTDPDTVLKAGGYGQMQRGRAQINLTRLFPEWMADTEEGHDLEADYDETARFVLPSWMHNQVAYMEPTDVTRQAFYRSAEKREAPFEAYVLPNPTVLGSFGFILNTIALLGSSVAASASPDVALPRDAFSRYAEENVWSLLGPQGDVAEIYMRWQGSDDKMSAMSQGERAVLGPLDAMGVVQFGTDDRGRPTAPANLLAMFRALVPMIGTQLPPMITQWGRGRGDGAAGVASSAAHVAKMMRSYPVDVRRTLEGEAWEKEQALRGITERREQESRR